MRQRAEQVWGTATGAIPNGWSRSYNCGDTGYVKWIGSHLSSTYCGALARTWVEDIFDDFGTWEQYYMIENTYPGGAPNEYCKPRIRYWKYKAQPSTDVNSMEDAKYWHFPNYTPEVAPVIQPSIGQLAGLLILADPFLNPVYGPQPYPARWPRFQPKGKNDPNRSEESKRGYTEPLRPDPSPRPGYDPPPKNPKPPPKGEKQKKVIVGLNNGTALGRVVGFVGEAGDFIRAVYKAIPWKLRREYEMNGRPSASMMLWAIYQHWEDIDITRALGNVFIDQVTDRVYGRIGQHYAGANRRLSWNGIRIQFQLGPAL